MKFMALKRQYIFHFQIDNSYTGNLSCKAVSVSFCCDYFLNQHVVYKFRHLKHYQKNHQFLFNHFFVLWIIEDLVNKKTNN